MGILARLASPKNLALLGIGSGLSAAFKDGPETGFDRLDAFAKGGLHGLAFHGLDELAGAPALLMGDDIGAAMYANEVGDALVRKRAQNPLAFGLGELAGAGLMGAATAFGTKLGKRPSTKIAIGALSGAAHGALLGAGAGEKGAQASLEERLSGALNYGLMGAALGGAFVPGTKAGLDLARNVPALAGYTKEYVPGRSAVWRGGAGFGKGTHTQAPLRARLAGEGAAVTRADDAITRAIAQDEQRYINQHKSKRFGRLGRLTAPFALDPRDSPTVAALIDYAARTPGGRAELSNLAAEADSVSRAIVSKKLQSVFDRSVVNAVAQGKRAAALPTRAKAPDAYDLMEFIRDPSAHASWVVEAVKLPKDQIMLLQHQLIKAAKQDPSLLADAQFVEKLQRVSSKGFKIPPAPKPRYVSQDAAALRAREGARTNSLNEADRAAMLDQAALSDEDAVALLRNALRMRRLYAIKPDADLEKGMLDAFYPSGTRFEGPAGWARDIKPAELELAVGLAQPSAAGLHMLLEHQKRQKAERGG